MPDSDQAAVRILQRWRGRVPGQIVDTLTFGVAHELVRRGVAEWMEPPGGQKSGRRRKRSG